MRRCFCGTSKCYPLCDGQHEELGWACSKESIPQSMYACISSMHYRSLAQKWGAQNNARIVEEEREPMLMCEELWIFCDGSDIESIIFHRNRVRADHTVLVSINISHQLLFALGAFDSVLDLQDAQSSSLWGQLHKKKSPPQKQKNPIIFLSHAVADEARWLPAFHELRHVLGHTIFSCSDSIVSGSNWYEQIIAHLKGCDWVLYLISKHSVESTFCAFEMGMARSMHKPMLMISIDDTYPPSYVQDLHMETLSRYCANRPWLTRKEALIECILSFSSTEIKHERL